MHNEVGSSNIEQISDHGTWSVLMENYMFLYLLKLYEFKSRFEFNLVFKSFVISDPISLHISQFRNA